jgi:hypothetical protein
LTNTPSIAELKGRVFKHSASNGPEVGNWLARRVGRPSAVYGTWLAIRLGCSAHAVTLASLVANLAGAAAIGTGQRSGFVSGAALLVLGYWLDHVDGQVARWRNSSSLGGVYFDYLLHHATMLSLGFALGFGLVTRGESPSWALAGFAISAGWTLLGLHNDCRYKAFFQRLKRDDRSYRIDGGSGGRPLPPPGWPMRWPGVMTWPMAKACEPQVVLMGVVAMAILALAWPIGWLVSWRIAVAAMAIVAPTMAIGRAAKAVLRDTPGSEFDRWFRPIDRE